MMASVKTGLWDAAKPDPATTGGAGAKPGGLSKQKPRAVQSTGSSVLTRQQILRQRAAALRKKPAEEIAEQIEILEFAVGAERYAVIAAVAREVQTLKEISPLPGVAAHVAGIIAVRGQVMPVIDLRRLFDLPAPATALKPSVLIVGTGESSFGILADEVIGVRRIKAAEIRPTPAPIAGKRPELFSGITTDRVAILRGEQLLSEVETGRDPS